MSPNFSQRIGLKPIRTALQGGSLDNELRVAFWNAFYGTYMAPNVVHVTVLAHRDLMKSIWCDFFHWRLDEFPAMAGDLKVQVRWGYDHLAWNEVYDFIEFVYNMDGSVARGKLRSECQTAMERYVAGYRFVGDLIAPITDNVELGEIDFARDLVSRYGLGGAREHLDTALGLLSDRAEPNYRNSIKESISAVESLLKIIADDDTLTLGQALSRISSKGAIRLNPLVRQSLEKLYAYTNNQGGIRHALLDEPDIGFPEAKFMLVAAAGAVNLLVALAADAGIDLTTRVRRDPVTT